MSDAEKLLSIIDGLHSLLTEQFQFCHAHGAANIQAVTQFIGAYDKAREIWPTDPDGSQVYHQLEIARQQLKTILNGLLSGQIVLWGAWHD